MVTVEHDSWLAGRVARAERIKRILIVFIAVVVTVALGLLGVVVAKQSQTIDEIRATQQDGSPSSKRIITLTERIVDCTTPGRPCYDDAQKRTAGAVGSINEITAIAVACGDQVGAQTIAQIRACVAAQVEELAKQKTS